MAEGGFLDNPGHARTAELIGHVTRSVLAILPDSRVEWFRFMATGLTVRVTLGERQVSYAFGPATLSLRCSVADHAKGKARDLCREVLGG